MEHFRCPCCMSLANGMLVRVWANELRGHCDILLISLRFECTWCIGVHVSDYRHKILNTPHAYAHACSKWSEIDIPPLVHKRGTYSTKASAILHFSSQVHLRTNQLKPLITLPLLHCYAYTGSWLNQLQWDQNAARKWIHVAILHVP